MFRDEIAGLVRCPELEEHIAQLAMHHLVQSVVGATGTLLGATEAAGYLNVTRQRMTQIAQEGKAPKPVAWIGGKRAVWLAGDLVAFQAQNSHRPSSA